MKIQATGLSNVKNAAAPQAPAQAQTAAAPAIAQDSFRSSDVKVITFNTAIGNPKITTNQRDFTKLPFYQATLKNEPGAAILCLQEVGNAQIDEVKRLAASGQFHVFSQAVGLRGRQNNMIVIPKRYQVVSQENQRYGAGHVKALAGKLWSWAKSFGKEPMNWGQLVEPRGYQKVVLKDSVTGKTMTVYNTHTSYYDQVKVAHNKQLFADANEAAKRGPVIVGGDLNTRTADTDKGDPYNAQVRAMMGDFQDMGPQGTPTGKTNIDWVLAQGFESVSKKWYTGDSIALPGSPDAKTVSDHYAEENVIRFK